MLVPGSASPLLFHAAAGGGGAYEVSRSVRFNSADSAYLSRTPGSAGNRKTWTWAGWVKRSKITSGDYEFIFGYASGSTYEGLLWVAGSDKLEFWSSPTAPIIQTAQLFRDPSAWFHIVLACDTTQATASNRVKLYINGSQVTQFDVASYPAQDFLFKINDTVAYNIGSEKPDYGRYFNGYLADIHFIDGQALDPTSFGEFDTNNVWQPKAFSGGSYGTNGFRLDFADNSSAAALGYDAAGSNDWTVNNLSVTAGSGNDSLRDSPTNGSQTDTGVGGEVVGNYATWNPLATAASLANGNLDITSASTPAGSSFQLSSGKWYYEFTVSSLTGSQWVAIGLPNHSSDLANFAGYRPDTGQYYNGSGWVSYGATYGVGDVIGVAFDLTANTIQFYKNGTGQGQLSRTFTVAVGAVVQMIGSVNFGQRPFAYTAPSGFKALCTTNLPAPTIANGATVMDVKLYTGNGSTQTISGLGFSPDLVWIKRRSVNSDHNFFDIVRGATNVIKSNNTDAEVTASTSLTTFNSDGFSVGSNSDVNGNTHPIVAWAWDAGTSNATNTSGSITSTVRANISAGFSIVTYTGNGSATATVGHGLGVTPALVIVKSRSTTGEWPVWFTGFSASEYMYLHSTLAKTSYTPTWGSTPNSSVFGVTSGSSINNNSGTTYVAYCWTPVAGYSAFGSYVGNGSAAKDGPFIYTGFRPRWIMIKNITFASDYTSWLIQDTARSPYNVMPDTNILWANKSVGEGFRGNGTLASAYNKIDAVSNGFKIREESTHELNDASATYIYAAFAEHPFQASRAR